MKCERLTLVNFCNHPHRVIEFNSGTTAIIGPNGSGKSHIMGGIRFALTGENPNVGTKTANIYDRIALGENSFVELVFSHGGVTATVRRNIKPARPTAVLTINNGAEVVEGDNEVTARIQRIVGITTDILNEIVIVGQEEIFGFLDKTPAKRAEQFQRLFQTEQAAVIYKVIGDQLKTVQIPEVGVDRDQIVTLITAASDVKVRTTQQLQGYPTFEEIQIGRQQNADVVTAYNTRLTAEQELTNSQTQRVTAVNGHTTASANLAKLTAERATIAESLAKSEAPAEAARLSLANLAGARQRAEARARLSNRVTTLQQQLNAAIGQAPAKPENYTDNIAAVEKTYSDVSVALAEHQRLSCSFNGQLAACPTCGTPVEAFHDKIAAANAAIPQLTSQLQALRSTIDRSRDYNNRYQLHQTTVGGLQGQVNSANQQLLDSPAEATSTVDEAALHQTVATAKTLTDGLAEYDNLIRMASIEAARWEGQLTAIDKQIERQRQQLLTMPIYTVEQVSQAQTNIGQWDQAAAARRQLDVALATSQADIRRLSEQLAAADRVHHEAEIRRGWHAFAESFRSVFHKDAAPRFVAQRNLEHLQSMMNEILQMFDTPFRVAADEGLSFQASFVAGSRQPAERLSGGQKVILALAFRLALNLMFAENIGALYLDEPTAWLDEHHIRGFEPVLQQLRDFSTARGLQTIIITHERALAPLFDTVVQL